MYLLKKLRFNNIRNWNEIKLESTLEHKLLQYDHGFSDDLAPMYENHYWLNFFANVVI